MAAIASTSAIDPDDRVIPQQNGGNSLPPLDELIRRSVSRTRTLFHSPAVADPDGTTQANRVKIAAKLSSEYRDSQTLPAALVAQQSGASGPARPGPAPQPAANGRRMITSGGQDAIVDEVSAKQKSVEPSLVLRSSLSVDVCCLTALQ